MGASLVQLVTRCKKEKGNSNHFEMPSAQQFGKKLIYDATGCGSTEHETSTQYPEMETYRQHSAKSTPTQLSSGNRVKPLMPLHNSGTHVRGDLDPNTLLYVVNPSLIDLCRLYAISLVQVTKTAKLQQKSLSACGPLPEADRECRVGTRTMVAAKGIQSCPTSSVPGQALGIRN